MICGPEPAAGAFGELIRVLGERGVVADLFQDACQVADGEALGQQVLEDALHLPDRELRRHQFVDERRMRLLQVIEQDLDILAAQDVMAAAAHRFAEVRDQHRGRIHDGEAALLGQSCVRRR